MRPITSLTLALALTLVGSVCMLATQVEGSLAPWASLTGLLASTLPRAQGASPRQAQGTAYYVRPDGGSLEQCTGLVNAPYPGSGLSQPCAWDHPFRALPPGGPPRIGGGDTLVISAGSYMMGYGAPEADQEDEVCARDYPWACHMPPIPSGPDPGHPTRILGVGWDSGCAHPPQLWGTERADLIINLTDASNVEVACLELTDHSSCVEDHSGDLACERNDYPYGDWAAAGIYAHDSANVHLRHLDIHGLASTGIWAGRLSDWTVEDVRVSGNGWVGWDGDIDGEDSNSGTLRFWRWRVEWNGCGETYPGGEPTGCWAQTAGGYGDGVGTGTTGGDWIIEDSRFLHNTSDGLDLLYVREEGSSITIRRTIAEGNAGNQIKTNGPVTVENSIIVGNCGFFDGQSFTHHVDNCRAYGNALALSLRPGDEATVVNNTLTSEGDCLVEAICEGNCDGSESILMRNNIFQGHTDFFQPFENTCLVYQEGFAADPLDIDYSVISHTKTTPPCPGLHDLCEVSPGLVNPSIDAFDAHVLADSPAIDAGTTEGAPGDDFDGRLRNAKPDIGAYEWWEPTAHLYLPLILRNWSDLFGVNDFLYQLENLDLSALGDTAYDLVVIDYSADGSEAGEFSAAQIAALKHSPGGDKIALAYMSIGEAEDYRFYWQDGWHPGDPSWLNAENPDWPGNYKVHYWAPAWQTIILSYTDRVMEAGFDGVYLDLIDAYEHYADEGRSTAAQEMADFVATIRDHVGSRGFYVFAQNAPELATLVPAYLRSVDGIGQEDIYYGYEADDQPTPAAVTAELEGYLNLFKDAGKLVLTIDYATTPSHVDGAYAKSSAQGYVPFVTVRDLDQLTVNPGHEPD